MEHKQDIVIQQDGDPLSSRSEDEKQILEDFVKYLIDNAVDLDSEISQAIREEFWELF